MRQALRSSLVLAVVLAAYACSGSFTSGANGPFDPGQNGGTTTTTTGDGGADAGDGGDGGVFTSGDAGNGTCNGLPSGMSIIDGCGNSAVPTALTVTQTGCAANFVFAGASTPCTGQLTGPNDAFDGGCAGLPLTNCTSTSLPGVITCIKSGATTCQLHVCFPDGGCP